MVSLSRGITSYPSNHLLIIFVNVVICKWWLFTVPCMANIGMSVLCLKLVRRSRRLAAAFFGPLLQIHATSSKCFSQRRTSPWGRSASFAIASRAKLSGILFHFLWASRRISDSGLAFGGFLPLFTWDDVIWSHSSTQKKQTLGTRFLVPLLKLNVQW